MTNNNIENHISKEKNYLINLLDQEHVSKDLDELLSDFLGRIVSSENEIPLDHSLIRIYAVGDISKICNIKTTVFVIEEFSTNFKNLGDNFQSVRLGQIPINVHNVGVYYRNFFDDGIDYFAKIISEHKFQNLTESDKPSWSLRKAIYLTEISKTRVKEEEALHFHLLRCSSNLSGATDNFRSADTTIVKRLNELIQFDFQETIELNHVLAQIYENRRAENGKEFKSKIKAHSDKTKDMPKNAVMAFCTFYEQDKLYALKASSKDRFDYIYKKTSGLTRLLFKLKPTVQDQSLVKEFSIILYPNSVFFISLLTNRLYTHEIKPSVLNAEQIPTRMGYVVRCSNLEALYLNNETYIQKDGHLVKLKKMTDKSIQELREAYYKENKLESMVEYGQVDFSMNLGDYEKPNY